MNPRSKVEPRKTQPLRQIKTWACATLLALAGCAQEPTTPGPADVGPAPQLSAPESSIFPTVNIAPAVGWSNGESPRAAPGLTVNAFASKLDHPRWLYVLPNGDVLVAESNAPPRPDDGEGFRGWAMGLVMRRAGAGVPSADRITLLRDANGDGVADTQTPLLEGLNSPFGMALIGEHLYVANTDAIVRFAYRTGQTQIDAPAEQVAPLPAGPLNHHWTKNILATPDGSKLYATVGSNSNIAENGMDKEAQRAAILEIDLAGGDARVFASGLRNPNGLAWQPDSGLLWTTVNERDELGDALVPDYMTSVRDGGFYGWPYSYYGQHVDERVQPQRPDLVKKAIAPDYALGAHSASLGLAFYTGDLLPKHYRSGAFIGQHGSWNRSTPVGYRVIFVPFRDGEPAGLPEDVLTGFVNDAGKARGRPVGVAVDAQGAVLVADDVGNTIWRITPAQAQAPQAQQAGPGAESLPSTD